MGVLNRVCRTWFHLGWNWVLQTQFLIHAFLLHFVSHSQLEITKTKTQTEIHEDLKKQTREAVTIEPSHNQKPKPRNHEDWRQKPKQKSTKNKPSMKTKKNKPERWQRLNPGSDSEGSRRRQRDLLMFLSGSLGGFLDSWSLGFLILDVSLGLLRKHVSWFLMFLCEFRWVCWWSVTKRMVEKSSL